MALKQINEVQEFFRWRTVNRRCRCLRSYPNMANLW